MVSEAVFKTGSKGEIKGIPNPKPLKINKAPIKTTTIGIAFWIIVLKFPLAKLPKYTTTVIKGIVPNPKRNM